MHMKSPHKRLLSGVKPTGRIHIGNYFGAIKQFVDLQNEYESFIMIADLHALTGLPKKEILLNDVNNLILDYLAVGLDPKKVILFKQSSVPAHANLAWVFNNLVSLSYLMRTHAFKAYVGKKHLASFDSFDNFNFDDGKTFIPYDVQIENQYSVLIWEH